MQSGAPGTARSISAAVVSVTNADFMDITGAGAGNWNLSAITGLSGDCGGNSGITFTTPATQTWQGTSGGNWSDVSKWTSRVPLAQDNVIVNNAFVASQTVVSDMPRLGANIDWTGASGTPTWNFNFTVALNVFGSVTLISGQLLSGTTQLTLMGRGVHTFTSAGKTFGSSLVVQGPGGTYTLQDALTTTGNFTVNDGTITTNNNSVTCSTFTAASGRNCTLNLGTSAITLTSAATTSVIQFQDTHTTVNGASAVFVISAASTLTRTIALQGTTTLGTVTYTVASSPGVLLFNVGSSSCTVTTLNIGSGRQLQLFAARTLTITNLNVNGVNQGYLYLPGVSGNYASAPDSAALSITGDIDIRVKVAMDRWTPAATAPLVVKSTGSPNFSYRFLLLTAGTLFFTVSVNGTAYFATTATSTAATGVADGAVKWVRVTWRASDGRTQFFTGDDGATWTQLGANVTMNAVSIFDGTSPVEIGSDFGAGTTAAGKFYRVQIRNNVLDNGTGIQFDAKLDQKLVGANTFTESSTNAATVTINGALAQVGDGRVAITSSTPGSAATLSYAGPQRLNLVNVTLQDITATGGAAGYFVYTQSGGNVSGNTGWTFGNLRTISDTGGNWSSTATWMEGIVPASTDHVVARSTSGNVTIDIAAVMRSMDLTGYTATLSGSGSITVGDGSGGSLTLDGTISGSWSTVMVTSSTNGGVGSAIKSNGKQFPNDINFNDPGAGTGTWFLQDALTMAGTKQVIVNRGKFFGNGKNITCGIFTSSNSNLRTVDITNCNITLSLSSGTAWNFATVGNLTLVATGSTITLTNASAFTHGSSAPGTYNSVVFNGGGTSSLNTPSSTFVNITRQGAVGSVIDSLQINGNISWSGTFSVGGNTTQGNQRVLITSNITGTQRTLTAIGGAAATFALTGDANFRDVSFGGSGPTWSNPGNAYIGDALGNGSTITGFRTAPITVYRVGANGNYSDPQWSLTSGGAATARVPLPQDNVHFDGGATGTTTNNMALLGADIDFTGFSGSFTNASSCGIYGSLTLSNTMALTANVAMVFFGRGSHTITTNGKVFGSNGQFIRAVTGTYTLADAFASTGTFNVETGTLTTNNMTITCSAFFATTSTCTLNFGTSTINLTQTATGTVFNTDNGATTQNGTPNLAVTTPSTVDRAIVIRDTASAASITYTVANSPGSLMLGNTSGRSATVTTVNVADSRKLVIQSGYTLNVTNWNVNGVALGYFYISGTGNNYAYSNDAAPLRIIGDIDIRAHVAPDDWTPAARNTIISKWLTVGNQRSYLLSVDTTGKLRLQWSADGTTVLAAVSTVAPPIADGSDLWIRATLDVDNGAAGNDAKFWTSPDGAVWTQLGATVTQAGVTSIFAGTSPVEMGVWNDAQEQFAGKFYRFQLRNNILDNGTGIVFDADFTTHNVGTSNWLNAAKTQFTEASANAATVAINGALAQVGDGRVVINSSTPGSRATVVGSPKAARTGQYLSVKDIQFEYFHALNSADAGNNNGVAFKAPPPKDAFLMAV